MRLMLCAIALMFHTPALAADNPADDPTPEPSFGADCEIGTYYSAPVDEIPGFDLDFDTNFLENDFQNGTTYAIDFLDVNGGDLDSAERAPACFLPLRR